MKENALKTVILNLILTIVDLAIQSQEKMIDALHVMKGTIYQLIQMIYIIEIDIAHFEI
jgi:hypothetical protein